MKQGFLSIFAILGLQALTYGGAFQVAVQSDEDFKQQIDPKTQTVENVFAKTVKFEDCDFSHLTLRNVTFIDCRFEDVSFKKASFEEVIFAWPSSKFIDVSFKKARFKGVIFADLVPEGDRKNSILDADFSKAHLRDLSVYTIKDGQPEPASASQKERLMEVFEGDDAYDIKRINWGDGSRAQQTPEASIEDLQAALGKKEIKNLLLSNMTLYGDEAPEGQVNAIGDVSFKGKELENVAFAGCRFEGVSFKDAELFNVNFYGQNTTCVDVSFKDADFQSVKLMDVVPDEAREDSFLAADFEDADMDGLHVYALSYHEPISQEKQERLLTKLKKDGAENIEFIDWGTEGAFVTRVNSVEEFLARIQEERLEKVMAHGLDLSGLSLQNIEMDQVHLNDCKLNYTDFSGCTMANIRIEGVATEMPGCKFDGARFADTVDFVGVNSQILRASFRHTDVSGMRIAGAAYSALDPTTKDRLESFLKKQGAMHIQEIDWLVR